jgi:hypothetical protein
MLERGKRGMCTCERVVASLPAVHVRVSARVFVGCPVAAFIDDVSRTSWDIDPIVVHEWETKRPGTQATVAHQRYDPNTCSPEVLADKLIFQLRKSWSLECVCVCK